MRLEAKQSATVHDAAYNNICSLDNPRRGRWFASCYHAALAKIDRWFTASRSRGVRRTVFFVLYNWCLVDPGSGSRLSVFGR